MIMALRTLYVKDFFLLCQTNLTLYTLREVMSRDKQQHSWVRFSQVSICWLHVFKSILNIVFLYGKGGLKYNSNKLYILYRILLFLFYFCLLYKNNTFQAIHSFNETKTSCRECDSAFWGCSTGCWAWLGWGAPCCGLQRGVETVGVCLTQTLVLLSLLHTSPWFSGFALLISSVWLPRGSKQPESFISPHPNLVFPSGCGER